MISREVNLCTGTVTVRDGMCSATYSTNVNGCSTCTMWCNGICTNALSPMYNKTTNALSICNVRNEF